ncbi:Dynein regulatory complex protein 10 [Frankliniella fusca]|uniref:Dynein regulatory complex protein 10 n=1 Tax=Frankliniella fusca TaxID=407009 RepID=A0AAE1I0M5_9NEOP|nr:Dynein regulatory complex protein 10 [Frankliniella fusca]
MAAQTDSDILCEGSDSSGPAAHQDVDFAVKTERVLSVLDEAIERAQLALCLPLLLRHDATLLRPVLPAEDLAAVVAACSRYGRRGSFAGDPPSSTMASYHAGSSGRSSLQGQGHGLGQGAGQGRGERWASAAGMVRAGALGSQGRGPPVRQDPELSRALRTLWEKDEVRDMVRTQLLPLVSSTGAVFLEYLARLRRVAAERLSRSPEAERAREAELCAAWRGGRQLDAARARLEDQIRQQAEQLGGQVADNARSVALLRHNVNLVRRQCQDEVKLIVEKSERAMVMEWRNSEHRQENLKAELASASDKMAATLAAHLAEEKELRVKRHKMETLLLTWLQKFDADVGEKFQEHEELTAEYESEVRQMKELTEKMADQEEEYRRLLAEKLRYEKEEEDEVIFSLASKHAAKVIQRAWRGYRMRKRLAKAAKKKGKGKGKGKPKPKAKQ